MQSRRNGMTVSELAKEVRRQTGIELEEAYDATMLTDGGFYWTAGGREYSVQLFGYADAPILLNLHDRTGLSTMGLYDSVDDLCKAIKALK
jgi:hypothetical protein